MEERVEKINIMLHGGDEVTKSIGKSPKKSDHRNLTSVSQDSKVQLECSFSRKRKGRNTT